MKERRSSAFIKSCSRASPTDGEKALLKEFLDSHEKVVADRAADGKLTIAVPVGKGLKVADPLRASAFVDLVHAVANSNEFVYRF